MAEYLSPGVYVEEVDAGPKPIEGVSTSTTGAVGVTMRGPTSGKPILVTSFADFRRAFGGFIPEPDDASLVNKWVLDPNEGGQWWQFPLSVKGFFDNGGQRLYVKRVFSSTSTAAQVALGAGVEAELTFDAAADTTTLSLKHLLGIDVDTKLKIFVSGRAIQGSDKKDIQYEVASYDATASTVTLKNPPGQELKAGRDFVAIRDRHAAPAGAGVLTLSASALGDWGKDVSVRVSQMVGVTCKILPDPVLGGIPARTTLTKEAAVLSSTIATNAAEPSTTLTADTNNTDTLAVADSTGFAKDDLVSIAAKELKVGSVPDAASIKLTAAGTWAKGALVQRLAKSGTSSTLTADANNTDTLAVADSTGFAKDDLVLIAGKESKVGSVPNATSIKLTAAGTWANGAVVQRLGTSSIKLADISGFQQDDDVTIAGGTFTIQGAPAAGAIVIKPAIPDGVTWKKGTTVTRRAKAGDTSDLVVADITGFNDQDHLVIAGSEFTVKGVPAGNKITVTPPLSDGETLAKGTPVQRLRPANAKNTSAIQVANASQLYEKAQVELDNGTNKEWTEIKSISGSTVTVADVLTKTYFEGHKLRVIEADVRARYQSAGVTEAEEHFTNLRLNDDGSSSYIATFLKLRSGLIAADTGGTPLSLSFADFPCAPAPSSSSDPASLWSNLNGGADLDGNDKLSVDDFVGVDGGSGMRTGIQALEDIDEISICAVPGIWSSTVQSALITHCETLRYRFAILDPEDSLNIEQIREFREPLDSKYAALYYPWIEVRDPSVQRNVQIAPSLHMAGIYARVDVNRGVHKAPANEVIQSISKIAQDITKREQEVLNPVGINALRLFPDRGARVWGARTISSDSSWKYINVRRLFIFVEASIDYGTQWVVFEPNDEPLWKRVIQSITNFLTTVWRSGALQGAKPDEAFFVKCDHTTMTQGDIDNGRLICVIGIAPVKPAEFVIFRIQQKTLDAVTS
jgi:phage tail sheath protein FI